MESVELPPLNALRAFEAAAKHQSISLAADELCVTHGAVSRQIKQLEDYLAVALFSKQGRGVKLTEAGERLYQASHQAFNLLRQVTWQLQQQQQEAPFVLSCPGSLLARWLIPRLDQLKHDLPQLQLQVVTHEGDDAVDIHNPYVNAYLSFSQPPWPQQMHVIELADERIGPVVSGYSALAEQLQQASPEQLTQVPLLYTQSRPQAWPNWLAAHGLTVEQLSFEQGFSHLYYLLEAAVAGLGVAIAPELLVQDDMAKQRLIAPWGFHNTSGKLVLLLPKQKLNPQAQLFARWLQQQIASGEEGGGISSELKS